MPHTSIRRSCWSGIAGALTALITLIASGAINDKLARKVLEIEGAEIFYHNQAAIKLVNPPSAHERPTLT